MTFFDPLDLPEDALPPQEIRFLEARTEAWPDGRRVRCHLTLTPFQQRPNLYAVMRTSNGEEACSAHIIETIDARMVFTLHLRSFSPDEKYTLNVEVYYEEIGVVDQRTVEFELHAPPEE